MKRGQRLIVLILCVVLTIGLFTGCSSKKDNIELTFLNSKGEIQEGLEEIAELYEKKTGVKIEVMACGAGESPFAKISSMYNSGNPPTLAMLDTTDVIAIAEEKAMDLTNEKWVTETGDRVTKLNDKIYSFPFCMEGRGIIYNKTAIDKTLGIDFKPEMVNSYDSFQSILNQLRAAGMENPVVLSKEDWSLGAHQLQYIYETSTGTDAGTEKVINELKAGTLDLLSYERFQQFVAAFDLLKEYNINKSDPLAALYEQDPIHLADGDAAFWFNGVWAWPNIESAEEERNDYGFIPYVLGNDTSDFANQKIQAAPSKQIIIDNIKATEEQKQAAKDFINWLVFDEEGQKALVEECAIVPVCQNNPNIPSDPLGAAMKAKLDADQTFPASAIVPGDHWSNLGISMQKYLAGQSTKEELATDIMNYWKTK